MTSLPKFPKIKNLMVKGLHGYKDIFLEFKDVTVIVGKNGMGKTTLLKLIHSLLINKKDEYLVSICDFAELSFTDNESISFGGITDKLRSELLKFTINERLEEIKKTRGKKGISKAITDMILNDLEVNNKINDILKMHRDAIFFKEKTEKYIRNELKIRYISTVNISFNADNNIDVGNSVSTNLLDLATEKEMRELLKSENQLYKNAFLEQINVMLIDTNKKFFTSDNEYWILDGNTSKKITLSQLSSGERQLIYILVTAANIGNSPAVFLMDEPEISLHLSWQEKILDALRKINNNMQIIIVTHSPAMIMNGYMDSYVDIKNIITENNHG
ncbi:AAA family ATPase [Serratia sp. DD3]|uniref:AAA family ATPase n=1 Tax=Serratia sp. DD3 TaxID=1410619 RepID=UPI0004DAF7E2|nr:ATP-binding protein [Serratia sp. DD3]KEY58159.1 hemin importer ATP-binding subunit [Serratia sp. DD3]